MVVATMGLIATAAPASAHASVVASTPGDGARLDVSPPALSFELNEPVSLVDNSAQVIDVDGTRYPLAEAQLESGRQRIVLPIAEKLPDGAYLATARVVSADTHVVSLSIRFTVGAATEQGHWSAPDGPSAIDRIVALLVKILVYLGTVGSAGLFLAARWVWPEIVATPRFRRIYRFGAGLLIVGLVGRFTVLAAEQARVAGTPFGAALAAAVVAGVIAAVRISPVPAVIQAATAVVAVTLGGHGGSTTLWPLPFVLTSVHVYAIAVWLGGIGIIVAVHPAEPRRERWHRVAVGHVALVVIAGTGLALLQVRPLAALVTTSYGITLVVKIALVLAALAAAYVAYRRFSGRTVRLEAAMVLVVLAVTSGLSSVTPARASYTTDVATQLDFGRSERLDVDIDTVRRGSQVVTVSFPAGAATPELDVELSSAQANVARLPVELSSSRAADGAVVWRSDGLIVPSPGRWKVTVRFDNGGGPKLASFYYQVL